MKKIVYVLAFVILFVTTGCSFNKLTVTFNSNGGSVIENQKINAGETITKPINPTKKGYVFKGWMLSGKLYNFKNKIDKNVILDAVWESDGTKVTYTVTYDIEGDISSKEVDIGSYAPEPTSIPLKKGYSFKGWYLKDSVSAYDFSTILNNDITLVAKFSDEDDESSLDTSKTIIYVTNIDTSIEKSEINIGESTQINVVFTPNNATNKAVAYTSSDNKIATVSASGIVKGIKAGSVTINIKTSDGGLIEDDVAVTVIAAP